MSEEDKVKYPIASVCGGYLKEHSYKHAWKIAFKNASDRDIELLKALPNFDYKVFEKITGIEIK